MDDLLKFLLIGNLLVLGVTQQVLLSISSFKMTVLLHKSMFTGALTYETGECTMDDLMYFFPLSATNGAPVNSIQSCYGKSMLTADTYER